MTLRNELKTAELGVAEMLQNRRDRWYPEFHIAARAGWINDPNGLSYFDGRYHVYFQHHPFGTDHGPMHWGHVSSADMVTWRREPIALAPSVEADRDGVFSGSAVVSDDGLLIAYYTGHRWRNGVNEDEGNLQVQCMAVSEDGETFEKQGVIVDCPDGLLHFRDPKVWRTGDTWYMIFGACSLDNRGQVRLYSSKDMANWEFDRVLFEDPDPEVFMLECPDMFPLGDKWVLIYCPMGPSSNGYRARNAHNAGYVVGNWAPGQDFEPITEYQPMDWGHQFYAPQTFESPDGRRIAYGWMGSFTVPTPPQATDGWMGQLTVARELSLDEAGRMRNYPVQELNLLRENTVDLGAFTVPLNGERIVVDDAPTADIELEIDLDSSTAERVGLQVHATPDGAHTLVCYDDLAQRVAIDRRMTGQGDRGYRAAPCDGKGILALRVLIDKGSVEVFINGGEESISSFSFPNEGPRSIVLVSESGEARISSLKAHSIGNIWEVPDR